MVTNPSRAANLATVCALLVAGCSDCRDTMDGGTGWNVDETDLGQPEPGLPEPGQNNPDSGAPFTRLDQLWVIDNSGSMCQEQLAIQRGFRGMLTPLLDAGVDLHIAVTTTHAPGDDANYDQEPVAVEGHVQSTPQPLPGFDAVCLGTYDAVAREYTDLQPLRDALAVAVECMTTPDPTLLDVTDDQLNCALPDSQRPGCVGGADRDGDMVYTIFDVFPLASQYRAIPKILRSADYADAGGEVDVDALEADFRCASLVGTRGYGLEKGLQAAVTATSSRLTGGPVGDPTDPSAPNHGLLRSDSAFSLVFVTDENDCSHDGDILEFGQQCRGAICDYENAADLRGEPSDLTSIGELSGRLRDNLSASKGRAVSDSEIVVASIHGRWAPFEGPMPDCKTGGMERPEVPFACRDADLGVAFSGDRYERFMRQFPNYYPDAVTGGDPSARLDFENFKETGEMCLGDLSSPLRAIGEQLAGLSKP